MLKDSVFQPITAHELLSVHLTHHDMQRLELYGRNMVDHHMILDTLPTITSLLFQGRMPEIKLSYLQVAIILATGLQHRDVDNIATELHLPVNQVLAFFNKTVRKIASYLRRLIEADAALSLPSQEQIHRIELNLKGMNALSATLREDQKMDEDAFAASQQQKQLIMGHKDLSKHAIDHKLNKELLDVAAGSGIKRQLAVPSIVSVPKGSTTATLPPLRAEDLEDTGDVNRTTESEMKTHSQHKKDKKRSVDSDKGDETVATTATTTTPKKDRSDSTHKGSFTDKKEKKAKKQKRESI